MSSLVIATGPAKGLGRAIADESIPRGHMTFGLARRSSTIEATHKYRHLEVDVADEAVCRSAMQEIRSVTKEQAFDTTVLMANAGDYVSVPIKDLSLGVVKKAIEANYYTFVSSALSFLSSFPKGYHRRNSCVRREVSLSGFGRICKRENRVDAVFGKFAA